EEPRDVLDRMLSAEAAGAIVRTRPPGSAESEPRAAEVGVVETAAEAPAESLPCAPPSPPPPRSQVSRSRRGLLSRPGLLYGAIAVASLVGGAAFFVRWLLGGVVDAPPSEPDDVDVTVFSPPQ